MDRLSDLLAEVMALNCRATALCCLLPPAAIFDQLGFCERRQILDICEQLMHIEMEHSRVVTFLLTILQDTDYLPEILTGDLSWPLIVSVYPALGRLSALVPI